MCELGPPGKGEGARGDVSGEMSRPTAPGTEARQEPVGDGGTSGGGREVVTRPAHRGVTPEEGRIHDVPVQAPPGVGARARPVPRDQGLDVGLCHLRDAQGKGARPVRPHPPAEGRVDVEAAGDGRVIVALRLAAGQNPDNGHDGEREGIPPMVAVADQDLRGAGGGRYQVAAKAPAAPLAGPRVEWRDRGGTG